MWHWSRLCFWLSWLGHCRAAASWRVVVCWSWVQGNLEPQLQVRDAAISLPGSFQLTTLPKSLIRYHIPEEADDLCVNLHPCFTGFGNQCPLHIIVSRPPCIMAQCC